LEVPEAWLPPISDVLDTGAGGLHHLVVGAAALVDVVVAEAHRHIVDQLCDLEALQVAVAAMGRDQRL